MQKPRRVLISGLGIAGPTLAFWLKAAGHEPTIVEKSRFLREGGYVIDFWGLGYNVAQKMGLQSAMHRVGYDVQELRVLDTQGRRVAGVKSNVFRELANGSYVTLERSTLSRLLFEKLYNTTEIQFDNEIVALDDRRDGVFVQLKKGQDRLFDLVIGADGLHSRVRSLVFGKQNKFENHLGYTVAAFEADGYRPRDENIYVMHGQPGRMVGRFALHDDKSLFLFVFSTGNEDLPTSLADQKRALREIYGKVDWECADILQALERSTELYFDSVSQIRMPRWSSGRVALVGDSAFCVSLLAGQGSALACTAAYILAGELARSECCHQEAFRRYENSLRPYIESKQRGARLFAGFFAPKTRMGLWFRNRIISGFNIPGLAKHAVGEELMDKLVLPDYSWKIAGRDLLRFRYSPPN